MSFFFDSHYTDTSAFFCDSLKLYKVTVFQIEKTYDKNDGKEPFTGFYETGEKVFNIRRPGGCTLSYDKNIGINDFGGDYIITVEKKKTNGIMSLIIRNVGNGQVIIYVGFRVGAFEINADDGSIFNSKKNSELIPEALKPNCANK